MELEVSLQHSQRPRHLSLSWARLIQSTSPNTTSLRSVYNIFLPSVLMSSKWPLSYRIPHQTPACASLAPSKFSLYLANSIAIAVSDPGLYKLFTFHVPNHMSLSLCLKRIERSVQVRDLVKCFITPGVVNTSPNPRDKGKVLVSCPWRLIQNIRSHLP